MAQATPAISGQGGSRDQRSLVVEPMTSSDRGSRKRKAPLPEVNIIKTFIFFIKVC